MDRLEKIRRLVIFVVLMQLEGYIPSPSYIEEKFNTAMNTPYPEHGLDPVILRRYADYMEKWIQPLQNIRPPRNEDGVTEKDV